MFEGSTEAKILVVSDFLRVQENAERTVLAGERRSLIFNALHRAGIVDSEIALTVIHAAMPPGCKDPKRFPAEQTNRDKQLCREAILASQANVIVPLGSYALEFITGLDSIDKQHLSILPVKAEFGNRKSIALFHPDRVQREFGLSAYISFGCMRIKDEMQTAGINTPPRRFLLSLDYSFKDVIEYLQDVVAKASLLAVDVETGLNVINTVGFAIGPHEAIAIETHPDHAHFIKTPEQFHELWQVIAKIWSSDIPKVAQNALFESQWASRYGIRLNNVVHDTMWAMKFLHPELEKGLANVGRLYTKFPYWKDDHSDWNSIRNWRAHLEYNCLGRGVMVCTEQGWIAIDQLARKKMQLRVRSFNTATSEFEFKPITNWLVKKEPQNSKWIRLKTRSMGNRKGLLVTPDHRILTARGWVAAEHVQTGDYVVTEKLRHDAGTLLGTYLGDASIRRQGTTSEAHMVCGHIHKELTEFKQWLFGGKVSSAKIKSGYKPGKLFHTLYVPACPQLTNLKTASVSEALNALTPLGIALWFMDDGCKQKRDISPAMRLAVQSYKKEEQLMIRDFFASRYGHCSLHKAGNIGFSVGASKKLCADLGAYFIPRMRYKLSHSGPAFSYVLSTAYQSKVEAISDAVSSVEAEVKNSRAYAHSYCISVADNANFLTSYGVVANCKDTTGTFEAYIHQKEALHVRNLDKLFYGYIMRFFPVIEEMCFNGLTLDPEKLLAMRDQADLEIAGHNETISREFLERLGREVNVRSPKQLQAGLKEMGIKLPTKMNKAGETKESADKKSLTKLKRKYPNEPIIGSLVEASRLNKMISSYLSFTHENGKIRYSLDGCPTETGRWAGYTDPWGNGFNPQTVPGNIRNVVVADAGKILVEIDLAQAESRYVAYEAPEPKLMEMLESGKDVHKYVASRIFKKTEEMVSKTERQLGKKSGHSANYGVGPRTFAESCLVEMGIVLTEQEARSIIDGYYETFPGIRRRQTNIQHTVRRERFIRTPIGRERHFYGRINDQTFREAYAYSPQSVIPDITNSLMLFLYDHFPEIDFLLQVHDSLLLQMDKPLIRAIYEAATDYKAWHPEIILPGGKLVIPIDMKVGNRWGNLGGYDGTIINT